MRIELDTDLFAFADYLNDNDCKMVMAAIFHQSNDNLSEKALVAFAPIMAQIDRQREHKAAVSASRSKAMREVHAKRAEPKPQPQPKPKTKTESVDFGEYQPAWDRYQAYRRERHFSKHALVTERSWLNRIHTENISVEEFEAMVNATIESGWQGLFPRKQQDKQPKQTTTNRTKVL